LILKEEPLTTDESLDLPLLDERGELEPLSLRALEAEYEELVEVPEAEETENEREADSWV
jgi:hypothetical protein